ncbi:MBL fold metallo-hydrolase [Nocardia sp. 852002-20019_SCH5090214]|jgi:glyoxylase-like metal-dependent hydrolase (beta-lactamase superfamily II)|uniref:MBL fold metallo-hydrolase n=1 Tax=Nocardia nova TaxID=37330 RepID=A0A2S6AFT6_9NOCA|nr:MULTISPECIES: MBL fold metallo-hydrolase [Nocardia]OBF63544.1 MBL fold metallo-hydrolase [Mycobacterium sp. 852002-51759_SCH5129042]MBF6271888.1 MBL fold metallo-hydrolase [Nocardia nova]MBV7702071.1 MBL fold metallo-hydrolase [Nocardia nova]OBA42408.1 MBL fold metallo-hydrolase [Nocardia sp. 852002-51101_SCH5132738]OBA42648.1 MBL fold metallo-hydrolase [Nocardia sp. 852002-20019_SCH5090214]
MTLTHPAYGQLRPVTGTASVLLADNPNQMTLEGTNTWILRAPDRSDCVVIDPGPKDKAHSEAIARATDGNIALTLITHHHHDHTGGIDRLVKLTGTPVRAMDPKYLSGSSAPLTDGEVIEAAGLRLTVLGTPGHTQDSVSLLLDDALITGDTVLGSGTTVLESRDDALGDYLDSLELLARHAPGRALLPAHGPDHPQAEPVIGYYIEHRHQRLNQVRAALRELGENATPLQVVAKVYADVDKRLWPAARSSVKAQLAYLRGRN